MAAYRGERTLAELMQHLDEHSFVETIGIRLEDDPASYENGKDAMVR